MLSSFDNSFIFSFSGFISFYNADYLIYMFEMLGFPRSFKERVDEFYELIEKHEILSKDLLSKS